jgi:hypothetical protein
MAITAITATMTMTITRIVDMCHPLPVSPARHHLVTDFYAAVSGRC